MDFSLAGLASKLTGGLVGEVMDTVEKYWPPDLSPEKKEQFKLALGNLQLKKQMQADQALNDAEKTLNERISNHEGTAKDLKTIPYLGGLIIFLRGCQRPTWGFMTMYFDFEWLTTPANKLIDGVAMSQYSDQQQTALIVINILVLGFLFGERAIKNVMPLILQYFGKKQ